MTLALARRVASILHLFRNANYGVTRQCKGWRSRLCSLEGSPAVLTGVDWERIGSGGGHSQQASVARLDRGCGFAEAPAAGQRLAV